jgi:hypothetical protein
VIVIWSPRLTDVGKRQSTRGVTYHMTDLKFSIMVSDSLLRTSSTQTKKAKRSSFKNFVTRGCSTFLVRKPTKSHLPRKDNLYKSCRHTRGHVFKVLRSNCRGFLAKNAFIRRRNSHACLTSKRTARPCALVSFGGALTSVLGAL